MAGLFDHSRGVADPAQLLARQTFISRNRSATTTSNADLVLLATGCRMKKSYSTTRARAFQRPSPSSVSSLLCRVSRLLRWPTLTMVQSGIRSRTRP